MVRVLHLVWLPLCIALKFSDPLVGCMSGETGLCSQRGTCVDEVTNEKVLEAFRPGTKCVCDSDWTGHADFIDTSNHDCSTHIPTITALWIINLVAATFLGFFGAYKLVNVSRILKENREALGLGSSTGNSVSRSRGKSSSPRANKGELLFWDIPLVRFAAVSVFQSFMLVILSGMKLSWNYFAGQNYGLAILMIFNVNTFWGACIYFLKNWMQLNIKISKFQGGAKRSAKSIMKRFEIFLKITLGIAMLSPLPVLIATIVQREQEGKLANIFTALFWILHVVTEICLAVFVVRTGLQIRNLLVEHESMGSKDHERAVKGISFMVNQVAQSGVSNVALGLLVSFWPWLRNKSSYMLCFGTLAIPLLLVSAVLILTPPRKQKTSSAEACPSPSKQPQTLTPSVPPPQTSSSLIQIEDHRVIETEIPENLTENAELVDHGENGENGEIELLSRSGNGSVLATPSIARTASIDSP